MQYETDVREAQETATADLETARSELSRVMEERKLKFVVELTQKMRAEKAAAEAEVEAEAQQEQDSKLRAMVEALERDKVKAVASLKVQGCTSAASGSGRGAHLHVVHTGSKAIGAWREAGARAKVCWCRACCRLVSPGAGLG